MRRANEGWRRRLSVQRDILRKNIAGRDPAPPKNLGDYVYRKMQDKNLADLDGAIEELDAKLARPDDDGDEE